MTRARWIGALVVPIVFMAALSATGHRDVSEKVATFYGIALAVLVFIGMATAERSRSGIRPQLRCPHCGTTGQVFVQERPRKKGVSGGKATAGILTGGLSLWFVGLSRKEQVQACHCQSCGIRWDIA